MEITKDELEILIFYLFLIATSIRGNIIFFDYVIVKK